MLAGYVHLFRALPALVVLFFAFYALPRLGFALQPFPAAVIGMVATSVAYVSEDLRAGIAAIGKGQWDAGRALGFSTALPWRPCRERSSLVITPKRPPRHVELVLASNHPLS